ncbi:MAG: hypothetical protein IJK87_06930 [Prevotella sp.]|nr:hypothetical protein [Prevotella sp.]
MKYFGVIISVLLAFSSCSHEGEAMRQRLDYVSECNRADTVFTEAWLPTVDSLAQYFDRHGNTNERMMAHYLQGRVHHDMGEAPQALACYRDATNHADTTDMGCDFKTLSRIYGQMSMLFYLQRTPALSIQYARMAEQTAYQAKDTLSAIIFAGGIAGAYHELNEMDSVLGICRESSKRFLEHGREDMAAAVFGVCIGILIDRHQFVNAKQLMDTYENKSGFFDDRGNIQRGKEIYYSVKGKYYLGVGKLDSVVYYSRKLLGHSSRNPDYKEPAYRGLMYAYQRMGKTDSVAKYASLYTDANDSAIVRHSSEEIVRMQSLYNYSERQKLADRKTIEAQRYRNTLLVMVVVCALTLMAAYSLWKSHKRKILAVLLEANSKYADSIKQYYHIQRDLELSRLNHEQYRRSQERELERLKEVLATYQDDNSRPESWDLENAILGSAIVERFHLLASKITIPSEKEWEDLFGLLHDRLPSFYQLIQGEQASLTEYERKASMLIRLRFIPSELAVLLGLSKQRISNIRRDINHKLFHEKGTRTLDAHIRRL